MADQSATEYDKLNPGVQGVQEQSWMHTSKGADFGSATGDLFKNLGETVSTAVKGVDTWLKQSIRTDATEQVDQERDRTQNWLQGGDVPAAVKNSVQSNTSLVSNLQTARNQGQISDAYYQMRLDTISRDLRSRYPGYREHIDNVMHDLTGVTPANKIISDLMHAANSKTDPETQLNAHLMKEAIDLGLGERIAQTRQQTGGNPDNNWLMSQIGPMKGALWQVNAQKASIELLHSQGKQTEEETSRAARNDVRVTIGTEMAKGGLFADVDTFRRQMEDVAKQQAGGQIALSPKQEQALIQQAQNIDQKIRTMTEARLADPVYARGLTPEAKKSIREEQQNLSELIRAGLGTNGKLLPGQLGLAANMLDSMQKGDQLNMLTDSTLLRKGAGLQKLLGHEAVNALLTSGQKTAGTQDFTMGNLLRDINGAKISLASGEKTITKIVEDKPAPGVVGEVTKGATRLILDKDKVVKDPAALKDTINGLYDNGINFIEKIKVDERPRVYQDMTSPEMTQRLLQLKQEGHPEYLEKYKKWVGVTGGVLARAEISTYLGKKQPGAEITFDPSSMRFTAERDVTKMRNIGDTIGYDIAQVSADNMNRIVTPLIQVLKGDGAGPEEVKAAIGGWTREAGIDLNSMVKQEAPKGESKPKTDSKSSSSPPAKLEGSRSVQEAPTADLSGQATVVPAIPERPPVEPRRLGNPNAMGTPKSLTDRIAAGEEPADKKFTDSLGQSSDLTPDDLAVRSPSFGNSADLKVVESEGKFYVRPTMSHAGQRLSKDADIMKNYETNPPLDSNGQPIRYGTFASKEEARARVDELSRAFRQFKDPMGIR